MISPIAANNNQTFTAGTPYLKHPGAGVVRVGVEKGDDTDNDVGRHQQRALEVVAAAVEHQEVGDEGRDEQADRLEQCEVERHFAVHDPADDDDERRDEERDLDRAADGDANRQVHLVLHGHRDGRDVLGRVADDGQDDETDEDLAEGARLDEPVDRVDHELGADGDERRRQEQENHSSGARQFHGVRLFGDDGLGRGARQRDLRGHHGSGRAIVLVKAVRQRVGPADAVAHAGDRAGRDMGRGGGGRLGEHGRRQAANDGPKGHGAQPLEGAPGPWLAREVSTGGSHIGGKLDSPQVTSRRLHHGVLVDCLAHGLGGRRDVRPVLVLAMLPTREAVTVMFAVTVGLFVFALIVHAVA
ncbi:dc4f53da-dfb0-4c38-a6c9-e9240d81f7be [Thermothielavioides terrestris]|uniref:Dc4f53da-dfb0-4c38-a6c9-e9240d81f7be n=1 Tax=Thermothielavioides terrestris TaxID=2587410 RepID=A0A446B5I3_9PEZI|nr:dc4f53da-dfb0-4c38-a6c9-e9240d81f7be [Thermothielavioides terrestris]